MTNIKLIAGGPTGNYNEELRGKINSLIAKSERNSMDSMDKALLIESCETQYGTTDLVGEILQDSEDNIIGRSAYNMQCDGAATASGNGTSIKKSIETIPMSEIGTVAVYIKRLTPRAEQRLYFALGLDDVYQTPNTSTDFLTIPQWYPTDSGYWWVHNIAERPLTQALGDSVNCMFLKSYNDTAPSMGNVIVDAISYNAGSKPKVVLSFDDALESIYTKAYPYLLAKGIPATAYLPAGLVGGAGKISWNNALELKAAGWGIGLNGTRYDGAFTSYPTLEDAVFEYTSQITELERRGLDSEDMYHTNYPTGSFYSSSIVTVPTLTSDGSNVVTLTSKDIPDGYTCVSYNVPEGATIVSGGGTGVTSLTLSENVPAGAHKAIFYDGEAEFAPPKLPNALKAAGVKSARTSVGGDYLTTFGFDGNEMLTNGTAFSGATLEEAKAVIDLAVLRGTTIEFYFHSIQDDPIEWDEDTANSGINVYESFFNGVVDYLEYLRSNNRLDIMTKREMIESVNEQFTVREIFNNA